MRVQTCLRNVDGRRAVKHPETCLRGLKFLAECTTVSSLPMQRCTLQWTSHVSSSLPGALPCVIQSLDMQHQGPHLCTTIRGPMSSWLQVYHQKQEKPSSKTHALLLGVAVATWCLIRRRSLCRRTRALNSSEGSNDIEKLAQSLQALEGKWDQLQSETDLRNKAGGRLNQKAQEKSFLKQAADLLRSSAMERLGMHLSPAQDIHQQTADGGDEALVLYLGGDATYVYNYNSKEEISSVGRAFWQAQLYLQDIHQTMDEEPVEDTAYNAWTSFARVKVNMANSFQSSILYARREYVSSAHFGYFLRRCRKRLALEMTLMDDTTPSASGSQDSLGQYLALEQALMEGALPSSAGSDGRIEKYLARFTPSEVVEIVRVASVEAYAAIESRAVELFGEEEPLIKAFRTNPDTAAQLKLTAEGKRRLDIDGAVFGAALFDAEEAAACRYDLHYFESGSRSVKSSLLQ